MDNELVQGVVARRLCDAEQPVDLTGRQRIAIVLLYKLSDKIACLTIEYRVAQQPDFL